MDFADGQEWQKKFIESDVVELGAVGLDIERFDLRNYFGNQSELEEDIREYGVIWVSGGNVFVLRQAMRLSGFDEVLHEFTKTKDIVYGGYSAGICVLAPSLRGLELVDSTDYKPYDRQQDIIWEGLDILDYAIVPHYRSNHVESDAIDGVVEYYEKHKILHKKLRDGEVIVIEDICGR